MKFIKQWNMPLIAHRFIFSYALTLLLTHDWKAHIIGSTVYQKIFGFFSVFHADSLIAGCIFALAYFFISHIEKNATQPPHQWKIEWFSFLFSVMLIIGADINYHQGLFRNSTSKAHLFLFIFLTLATFYVVRVLFLRLFALCLPISVSFKGFRPFETKQFMSVFLPMFSIRSFAFWYYFPGYFTWDSMYMIKEGMGSLPLSNSHPFIYVYVVGLFGKLGLTYFQSVAVGLGIFNFIVMTFTSVTFSYVLYKLSALSVKPVVKWSIYLYYIFNPLFIFYSFILYKDVLLLNFLMLFMFSLYLILYTPQDFFRSYAYQILFISSIVGVYLLHRKAVIYVAVGALALLIFSTFKKRLLSYFVVASFLCVSINFGFTQLLQPLPSHRPYDHLSTRVQQLAATVLYHPKTFSDEELALYDKVFDLDNTKKYFEYWNSDNVKNEMKNDLFKENFSTFVHMWIKGYLNHPKTYLDAMLNLSVSYWYPYSYADVVYFGNYYYQMYSGKVNWIDSTDTSKFDKGWTQLTDFKKISFYVRQYYIHRLIFRALPNLPLIGMLYRPGFYTWILLFMSLVAILRKNRRIYPILLLLFSIILTCIYSPLANYFRYSYLFISLIPMSIPFVFTKDENFK